MTKKFLSILFRTDVESVSQLQVYGFSELFDDYQPSEILFGKKELKKLVIKFLNEPAIEEHVEGR
jgi:hypothetical protein